MTIQTSDDFPLEARIDVNLQTGHVDFEHLTKRRGRFWVASQIYMPTLQTLSFFLLVSCLPLFMFGPLFFFWEFAFGQISYFNLLRSLAVYSVIMVFLLYGAQFLAYPLSFVPSFRKNFPKLGALSHTLSGSGTKISVTKLEGNRFLIPMFKNAYLSWKTYGEWGAHLQRVQIIEHPFHYQLLKESKIGQCRHWQAIFYFDEPPKSGFMVVKYL